MMNREYIYEDTYDAYISFQYYIGRRMNQGNLVSIILPYIQIAPVVVMLMSLNFPVSTAFLILTVSVIIIYLGSLYYIYFNRDKLIKKGFDKIIKTREPYQVTLMLTDTGIKTESKNRDELIKWAALHDVMENENFLYIMTLRSSFLIIPMTVFKDEEEKKAFMETVRLHIQTDNTATGKIERTGRGKKATHSRTFGP